jgi:hypothetical protein
MQGHASLTDRDPASGKFNPQIGGNLRNKPL